MPSAELALERITAELLDMGRLVESQVRTALGLLTGPAPDAAELDRLIKSDKVVDQAENTIDLACNEALAIYTPVADDLRKVLTIMMVNGELERMGDHAKNIARSAKKLYDGDGEPLPIIDELQRATDVVVDMVHRSLGSLVASDGSQAKQVYESDSDIDQICKAINPQLMRLMQEQPVLVPRAVEGIRVVHNIERIGDLAANVAKDVVFLATGEVVRHDGRTEHIDIRH